MRYSAIIIGIKGKQLTKDEIQFLKKCKPVGVILFSRNIYCKEQTINLVKKIKFLIGRDAMILIDQEGGRVSRLSNKWSAFPPAKYFGDLSNNSMGKAKKETFYNYKNIGKILNDLGINFNCAPVLDLSFRSANKIIGDRAFSSSADIVSKLALEACKGLLESNVLPIIKHIPGHGRAKADSHLELPEINTKEKLLEKDFLPFIKLSHMPLAMIAHIKYSSLDKNFCATYSKVIIDKYIRGKIGFNGILLSDDLCMKALKGPYFYRAKKAINAGCDILLHCDGNLSNTYNSYLGAGFVSKLLLRKIHLVKKSISNNKN